MEVDTPRPRKKKKNKVTPSMTVDVEKTPTDYSNTGDQADEKKPGIFKRIQSFFGNVFKKFTG